MCSDPDLVVRYPDGNRCQIIDACFWAEVTGGTAGLSDEVTEVGWFRAAEAESLTVIATHLPLLPVAFGIPGMPYFD